MKYFIRVILMLTATALLAGCADGLKPATSNIHSSTKAQQESSEANISEEAETILTGSRFVDYDFSAYSENIQYNENPDISFKPLPSAYDYCDYSQPRSSLDLLKDSTGVAILHILNGSEVEEISLTGDSELDKAISDKTGDPSFATLKREAVQAQVVYNVYGEQQVGEILTVSMFAEPWGTELVTGKDYLVILAELKSLGRYTAIDGINSIYEIKDDFTVVSQSPMYESAKYDGLSLADIVHDFAVHNEIRMEKLKAQEESLVIE